MAVSSDKVTIYYNPACGTARKVLAAIRDAGIEPRIVRYLEEPPSRIELQRLLEQMGVGAAELVRRKEKLFGELGLDAPGVTEAQLLDAMAAHPVLINRPFVVTTRGTRLCRPAEKLSEILP